MTDPKAKTPEAAEAARREQAQALLASLSALYPEARNMLSDERRRSLGRLVYRDADLYAQLFDVIDGSKIRAAFDALGAEDNGDDPERFETEVLRARLRRVGHLSAVSTGLRALADRLDDEALHLGAETATPALLALELARVLAKSNASFRGSIAPVLDALSAMTLAARNALAAARESEAKPATEPKAGEG